MMSDDDVDVESEPDDGDSVENDTSTKAFEKADPVIADFEGFCDVIRDIYEEVKITRDDFYD